MNRKLLFALGGLAFVVALLMFIIGNNDSKLSELADLFWIPIPLGALFIAGGVFKKG